MLVPLAFVQPGQLVSYDELYPVIRDDDSYGILVVDEAQDFDRPRDDAEYVRGLGFLFNERTLTSSRRA
jgi:hypothetical protein